MNLNNNIVLRPRFSMKLNQDAKIVLEQFKSNTKNNNSIRISVIEPHIFLKIAKKNNIFGRRNYILKSYSKEHHQL